MKLGLFCVYEKKKSTVMKFNFITNQQMELTSYFTGLVILYGHVMLCKKKRMILILCNRQLSIGLGNDLASNTSQAMTQTINCLVHLRYFTSPLVYELSHPEIHQYRLQTNIIIYIKSTDILQWRRYRDFMVMSSNGNVFHVTGLLCGEFTGHRWIPHPKASDAEFWCFLWSPPEPTENQTMDTPMIWEAIALIMTSL